MAALYSGAAAPASAQMVPIEVGSPIRLLVLGSSRPVQGVLREVSDGTLTLVGRGGEEVTVAVRDVRRAQLNVPRTNTLRGGIVGGAVGLGVGIWRIMESGSDCPPDQQDPLGFCRAYGDAVQESLLIWPTLIGAGLGAYLGSRIRTGRWVPALIPLESGPRIGTTFGLRWSVPFGGRVPSR